MGSLFQTLHNTSSFITHQMSAPPPIKVPVAEAKWDSATLDGLQSPGPNGTMGKPHNPSPPAQRVSIPPPNHSNSPVPSPQCREGQQPLGGQSPVYSGMEGDHMRDVSRHVQEEKQQLAPSGMNHDNAPPPSPEGDAGRRSPRPDGAMRLIDASVAPQPSAPQHGKFNVRNNLSSFKNLTGHSPRRKLACTNVTGATQAIPAFGLVMMVLVVLYFLY